MVTRFFSRPDYSLYKVLLCTQCILLTLITESPAQSFWTETFGSIGAGSCDVGTLANGFVSPTTGTWTVTNIGAQDSAANTFYISAAEPGHTRGSCSSAGCLTNPLSRDRTLHVGSVFNSPNAATFCLQGDCGAYFDAGGATNAVASHKRAESPVINCTGKNGVVLSFNYIEGWDLNGIDNALVEYFDGTSWASLADPPHTDTTCSLFIRWTHYSVALPSSASNNPAVKIGFTWINNNGGGGPHSFAVDSIVLSSTLPPVADFTVNDTDICEGGCINFRDTSLNSPTTYSWSFVGSTTLTSSSQNPSNVCYLTEGTYDVQLIVTNAGGSDTLLKPDYITVNSCSPPIAHFYSDSTEFCERYCTSFNDTSENYPTSWLWLFPGAVPDSSTLQNPDPICYYTPGFHNVTLIVSNAYGSDTLIVPNYIAVDTCPLPMADFSTNDLVICSNRCINFTDLSTETPIGWAWSFPGAVPDTSTQENPLGICYSTDGFYDVQLIVQNQYGYDTLTRYSYIKVESVPTAFACQDTAMYFGSSYHMNAGGGIAYVWSPATGLDSVHIADPIATPLSTTTYQVLVYDTSNCWATRQVTVTILHDNNTFVPNSFSPDQDGNNDYLYVHGNNLYGIRFTVFDRWGEKVFETTDLSAGWDGRYKGKALDPAVFTYVLNVNFEDGTSKTESGTVNLIR